MLLTSLALATFLAPTIPSAATIPTAVLQDPGKSHGKLTWFEGSFEEALARAKAQNQYVFIDFWASW